MFGSFAFAAIVTVSSSPVAQAVVPACRQSDDTGLGWAICNVPELKRLVASIELRQRYLARRLGAPAGWLLSDEWDRLLNGLRRAVGVKWLDIAQADVAAALSEHLRFLAAIDLKQRAGLAGLWGNGRTELRVASDGSVLVRAAACEFFLRSPAMRRKGPVLRLTIRRRAYAAAGCDSGVSEPAAMEGMYLPLLPE